jgi:hypothetical protein
MKKGSYGFWYPPSSAFICGQFIFLPARECSTLCGFNALTNNGNSNEVNNVIGSVPDVWKGTARAFGASSRFLG